MGHYASEMLAGSSDEPDRPSTDQHWVVGDGFTVLRAIDYQATCQTTMPYMARMMKTHYEKREDAEAAAKQALMDAFEDLQTKLSKLRQIEHKKPWTL
jgi:hypothetical protein